MREDKCAVKGCRLEGELYVVDKWLCAIHWDKYCKGELKLK